MSEHGTAWKLLSVEDDAINRALLRATLASAQDPRLRAADLAEATTLAAARGALRDDTYDLVLLDRRLPDGDGFELAGEIRRSAGRRPRIVALTADAVPQTLAGAMDAGCDVVATKPYVPAELAELIVNQLESTTS